MTTLLTPVPSSPGRHTAPVDDDPRPAELTVGAVFAWALCLMGSVGLFLTMVGMWMFRYSHDSSGLNFAGPPFALLLAACVVVIGACLVGMRAAKQALDGLVSGRDSLVALGAGAILVAVVTLATLFAKGNHLGGWIGVSWAVLVAADLALLSAPTVSTWLQTRSPWGALWRGVRGNIIAFLGLLVMLYLYIPNVVVAAMSFNHETGKHTTYQWYSFTWSNWSNMCGPAGMCHSLVTSLWIGAVATVIATIIGTLAAFALMRHQFAGRSTTNTILFLPMATPDIVMGSSLLAFFVALRVGGHLGHTTIIIAHVMFCLSYVVVTVKARLAGMDSTLQQAAMDLYATESQTFWKVTFPLVFPGILAAALLSFSLSFDDYIITNLNAGTVTTFPIFVWGAALRGLPMQVNVIGTLMFLAAIVIVVVADLVGRSRARSRAA